MPVQTHAPSFPVSFPSFMSVFGTGSSLHGSRQEEDCDGLGHTYGDRQHNFASALTKSTDSRYPLPFPHRESLSSTNSESTDSSPTTTISTFDSASITDNTPSSSPESPTSVLPLSDFKPVNEEPGPTTEQTDHRSSAIMPQPHLPYPGDPDIPERKARNARNLSVNIATTDQLSPITSFARVPVLGPPIIPTISAPVSPMTFSQPKPAPRNRFNLSIRTPGLEKTSFLTSPGLAPNIPPTPAGIRRPPVRHFPSSPALSIFSPMAAPHGGMQLPPVGQAAETRSKRLSQSLQDLKEEDDHYDVPEFQEKQETGYPDGPVCIYDSGVYLYLEPTREEASGFDCVINVAKEVLCPFVSSSDSTNKEFTITSVMRHGYTDYHRHTMSEPQTAVSEFSFKSAFEYQPAESPSTPTTPKPEKAVPEYLHLPWDHNSDILDDAYVLCKIIDQRVSEGKKVLVHCQLGASRSASLIIAYGMFKSSSIDFNRAYENVKSRSKWISPNMSLIYQLSEFRSKLNNGHFEANPRIAPPEWFKFGAVNHTPTVFPLETKKECEPPSTKKLIFSKPLPPLPKIEDPKIEDSTPSRSIPASILPTRPLPPTISTTSNTSTVATQTDETPFFPRPTRLRERASGILQLSVDTRKQVAVEMDLVSRDVPETPSLLSPRAAEFSATAFHRTAAGDLSLSGSIGMPTPFLAMDPRSPPHHGDATIIRSIDDFL